MGRCQPLLCHRLTPSSTPTCTTTCTTTSSTPTCTVHCALQCIPPLLALSSSTVHSAQMRTCADTVHTPYPTLTCTVHCVPLSHHNLHCTVHSRAMPYYSALQCSNRVLLGCIENKTATIVSALDIGRRTCRHSAFLESGRIFEYVHTVDSTVHSAKCKVHR